MPQYQHDLFISYAEADHNTVLVLAEGLENAGYRTWHYRRDALPGPAYLTQVIENIDKSRIVLVIISADSLDSTQVYNEITYAHENHKSFMPILKGINHSEFQKRRPDWRMILGAYTTIQIPEDGVNHILNKIIEGTRVLLRNTKDQSSIKSSDLEIQNVPIPVILDGVWKGSWKRENANILHEGHLSIRQKGSEIDATLKISFMKMGATTILEEQLTGAVEGSRIELKGRSYEYIEKGKSISYLLDRFILQIDETGTKLSGQFTSKKGDGKAQFIRIC